MEKFDVKTQQRILSKINIVTTSLDTPRGMVVRKVTNATDLSHQLRATSWIPYLTGDGWFLPDHLGDGTTTTRRLMDGDILARMFPPRCDKLLHQPIFSLALLQNILVPISNVPTGRDLWDYGYSISVSCP